MPEIHLRPYQARDPDAIVLLWYDTWHATFPDLEHPDPLPLWRRRFVSELLPRGTVWVATHDERIIGFIVVFIEANYLDQIFVDVTYHGQGIATTLLNQAKTLCLTGHLPFIPCKIICGHAPSMREKGFRQGRRAPIRSMGNQTSPIIGHPSDKSSQDG